jgi:hypothetical protein
VEVTTEQLLAMRVALEGLPEPNSVGGVMKRAGALRQLAPLIKQQLERGHSYKTIVSTLQQCGVPCSYIAVKEATRPRSKGSTPRRRAKAAKATEGRASRVVSEAGRVEPPRVSRGGTEVAAIHGHSGNAGHRVAKQPSPLKGSFVPREDTEEI